MERAISGLFNAKKSVKDLAGLVNKVYPTDASSYELLEDCGRGVSATVYRAYCKDLDEIVAVKKMNLESVQNNLDEIVHEAQLMKNYHHPNVLPLHTSFVHEMDLWMVVPFVSGGSVLHIIKYAHPEGLEEVVIATIMRDVLKALDYVHRQGGIHRDIKAGNILVDKDGCVKLGDFGVATSLERNASWGHDKASRMTFVGTPCWMAPEVMEQTAGYDNGADIWSFGITMLEMAHGHAPFAKYPPMKVLLMTLQNPAPTLEDEGTKRFSKAMRNVVQRCLQKDPRARPTASQLLEHKFFKQAKDEEYLAKHLMAGLPPLSDRVQEIRQGKAATLGADNERNFARSQEEYKKGVSSWNFDVSALKAQADLEADEREPMMPSIAEMEEQEEMTLSAMEASSFVHAQQAAEAAAAATGMAVVHQESTPGEGSVLSVFGTQRGQAATIMSSSGVLHAAANGPGSSTRQDVTLVVECPSVSPPGPRSPNMSREGSMVTLQTTSVGGTSTIITASVKQKKGRFSVYDEGEMQQPVSAGTVPAVAAVAALAGLPTAVQLDQSSSFRSSRDSEDGSRRDERVVTFGETVVNVLNVTTTDADGTTVVVEPKKKGRFTVIENGASLERKASRVNLTIEAATTATTAAGKAIPPVTALLPKLQELLDQAAQQQEDLRKLVGIVQESERSGKRSPLSKSMSVRTFDGGAGITADSDNADELRVALEALQSRLAEAEADNARLRSRNLQLEQQLSSSGGFSVGRGSSDAGSGTAGQTPNGHSPGPTSPLNSNRPMRFSEDDVH